MKIHRKIGIGLVLITALLAGLFFSHSSSAAPSFSAAWIDRSNIQVTGEGKTVVLTDGKWDAEWKYEGTLDSCVASLIGGSLIDGFDGDLIVGFSDNSGNTNPSAWNDSVSRAGNFRVYYNTTPTYNSCTWFSADTVHINDSPNAQLSYRWTDNGHGAIARVDDGSKWTFSKPVKIPSGFDSGKTRFFRDSETGKACQDLIDVSPDGGTMWLYEQVRKGEGGSSGVTSPPDPNCNLKATINDLEVGSATVDQWHQNIPSNYPLPLGEFFSPGDSGDGGVTGTDDACYSSGWQLSWIACPVITAAQTAANSMYGFVEDQLKFTVLQYCPPTSSNPNPDCADSLGEQHNSVHSAWNNIRILVSSLVVILLLVMVIAQAIGSGPLDAYTVRKMLPRLVAGVILIQVSWPVFSWVVNTVDHLGVGLADIMYAPFGGSKALDLNTIMQPFTNSVAGGAKVIAFNYASIGALAIFGVASPFVVLGLILTVMVAIFVGFLTLLFRKILIILALIFVPVALISWMMPNDGLRKYWKLWWDNFIKALMMFPLIIAIIAGGRIFAKIGSGGHDFVGFFIVLVGFFGPLFILPKTFKWGGTLMQTAGSGITSASQKGLKKPLESLKGFNERYQGKHGKEYNPLANRGTRAFRRIQSGHFLPTERSRRLTVAAGNKWADERNDEAMAYATRTQEKALAGYDNHDVDADGNFLVRRKNADGQYLDAAGNVVKRDDASNILQVLGKDKQFKKQATFEHMTGVEAGKQALIDIAGNDGGSVTAKRAAQAAVKQLIDTHSEIELQKSRILGGANQGRRVNEVYMWRDTITNSPPHYSAINNSRPDLAPDLEESAQEAASRRLGREVKYETASAADRHQIDVEKSRIAIERLTPEQAAQAHYGFYRDIGRVGAEPAIDPRTNAPILDAAGNPMNISQLLAQRLIDFNNSPGTVGRSAVGSLHGGKQEHVDAALLASGHDLEHLP